jgi:hypothetical protein
MQREAADSLPVVEACAEVGLAEEGVDHRILQEVQVSLLHASKRCRILSCYSNGSQDHKHVLQRGFRVLSRSSAGAFGQPTVHIRAQWPQPAAAG